MMTLLKKFILIVLVLGFQSLNAQQLYTKSLMKADKLYIKKEYDLAAAYYVQYLGEHPRDYYASRQAALCYDNLDDQYSASDYWPAVIESSESTEDDFLRYARCLIENDRMRDAGNIFPMLSKSNNPYYANWGKAWAKPSVFFNDSAEFKIHYLKNLNTSYNESCPYVLNGKLLYQLDKARNPRVYTPAGDNDSKSVVAVNLQDTAYFTASELLSQLYKMPIYGQVTFSPDGQEMYFCKAVSNKDAGKKSPFYFVRYQIFVLNMSSLDDKVPQIKPFSHNAILYNYMHPSISPDGEHLFFASDMKGSTGGADLYVCHKLNGEWSTPINLGASVNTPGNEVYPQVLANGTLYFASDGWPGLGGLDLFYSEFEAGVYEKAKNVGYPLNTRYDDFGMYFTQENKGYFSSNRFEGTNDDLYFFARYR